MATRTNKAKAVTIKAEGQEAPKKLLTYHETPSVEEDQCIPCDDVDVDLTFAFDSGKSSLGIDTNYNDLSTDGVKVLIQALLEALGVMQEYEANQR